MNIRKVFAGCLLALTIPFAPAHAYVDPPTFSPEQPYAGQAVQMSVKAGQCHGLGAAPAPGQDFLEVQVQDDIIDVIITGVNNSWACSGPHSVTVDIGGFPEGSYTVRVRIRSVLPPFTVHPPASEAALVVAAAPPVLVPATRMPVLIGLLGLVAIAAVLGFRRIAVHS